MEVKVLDFINYRNYEKEILELSPDINVFLGLNAQGKTNIVEAVYYAAVGHAYRTNIETELIRWEQERAALKISFTRLGIDNRLEFYFQRKKRRRIVMNGQKILMKEMVGNLNAVLFSPEDLFLLKGSPAGRRRFLDLEISQSSPSYYHELIKYNRVVFQRNNLLKKIKEGKADKSLLDIWNGQLAESAAFLVKKRIDAVKKLNMLANLMQRRISGNKENLVISYILHGDNSASVTEKSSSWYNEKLTGSFTEDVMRGSTNIGPHRDDISFFVNGIDLKAFGSQGQQRTGILSLKLSELEFIRSETGEYPILLLDDVMSELDAERRSRLLSYICREHIQTIITATDEAYFPAHHIGRYYNVTAGNITLG